MIHSSRCVVLAAVVALAACKKEEAAAPLAATRNTGTRSGTRPAPSDGDSVFRVSKPRIVKASVPERFSAALPACRHPVAAEDPVCDPRLAWDESLQEPVLIDGKVTDSRYDEAELLAVYPRADVVAALARCAVRRVEERDKRDRAALCLARLAGLDRQRASDLAKGLANRGSKALREVSQALVLFPSPGSLRRRLVDLGFAPGPLAQEPKSAPASAEEELRVLGRISELCRYARYSSDGYENMMCGLAAVAAPALEGVVFEEIEAGTEGGYVLRAYMDGRRWEVDAQDKDDQHDVEAVVGLANALLIARGSEMRLVSLPADGRRRTDLKGHEVRYLQTTVLAGPRAGILALAAEGLIHVGGPEQGEGRCGAGE